MEEQPAPTGPDTKDPHAYEDFVSEGASSRRLKRGILVLAAAFLAWTATWLLTGSMIFGWIPALIIVGLVNVLFRDKPRSLQSQRLRSRR